MVRLSCGAGRTGLLADNAIRSRPGTNASSVDDVGAMRGRDVDLVGGRLERSVVSTDRRGEDEVGLADLNATGLGLTDGFGRGCERTASFTSGLVEADCERADDRS